MLHPTYNKEDVQTVTKVLPSKVMILVHISGPAVEAYAMLFAKLQVKNE